MTLTYIINPEGVSAPSTNEIYQWTWAIWSYVGLSEKAAHVFSCISLLVVAFIVLVVAELVLRRIAVGILSKVIARTKATWDDKLIKNKALGMAVRLILVILAQQLLPYIFVGFPSFNAFLAKALTVLVIISIYTLINSVLKTVRDIMGESKSFADKPLDSYLQVVQIFLVFITAMFAVSVLTGSSPWSFFVSLGAASAILMLVFKDTILGFVASIQVSANDSVRVGDWIEMPKYGVDGDVLQINLNNVRVRNWDKTIVTIPTYTLLSDSFKNYRGMQETGGRRIKRAIQIKISSIRYLEPEEIEELKKIRILKDYIEKREQEIADYNNQNEIDESVLVNGRRMTNVGLFRAYANAYARQNPDIHQEMTLLVRQLDPTEHGLPLELYMFTNGTSWAFFEDTMSDLFDHLFAAIKYFKLEVFESPASDDLRSVMRGPDTSEKSTSTDRSSL
ncbi:MAG: mechanosensitive ion channel family protein [Sphingobacterium sp.]